VILFEGLLHVLAKRYHNTKLEFHWRERVSLTTMRSLSAELLYPINEKRENHYFCYCVQKFRLIYDMHYTVADLAMRLLWALYVAVDCVDCNRRLYFLSPHFSCYATQILSIKCPYERQNVNEATPNWHSKSYSNKEEGYKTIAALTCSQVSSNKTYFHRKTSLFTPSRNHNCMYKLSSDANLNF
jgi:hypothetical protein